MNLLSTNDWIALAAFALAWLAYHGLTEWSSLGKHSLNARMNAYRDLWAQRMLTRENRVVETTLVATLQNGTAFFASTALLAVGGALALLRATDEAMQLLHTLPWASQTTLALWEAKAIGLAVIFVYAFFKFAWAYRLFAYVAILVGALPPREEHETPQAQDIAGKIARLSNVAGRNFNRGQRAFFFALGYLGWFVHPYVFMATTLAVLIVMARRQFASDSLSAIADITESRP